MVMPRVLVELLQHSALLRGAIHSEQPPLLPLCSLHALWHVCLPSQLLQREQGGGLSTLPHHEPELLRLRCQRA